MSQRFGLLFTVLMGGLLLRLSGTGEYLSYVRPGMRPWLLSSAAVLFLVGLAGIGVRVRSRVHREETSFKADEGELHAHQLVDHEHEAPKAAWLLVLPVIALLAFPSKPLGSFAAARQGGGSFEDSLVQANGVEIPVPPDLPPPVQGAQSMEILDFLDKSYYDPAKTLAGRPVTITGFVAPSDRTSDNFLLTRFVIACCAADARPVQIAVSGYGGFIPPADTWVEVTGTWIPEPEGGQPRLGTDGAPLPNMNALRIAPIRPPDNPYATFGGL